MIEKIEIQYFRSIYRATISNISDINIFSGKNDAGKSNVLKALNLFFNNYVVSDGDYTFKENYNLQRLDEVRRETVKGKQFIQIKITFKRGLQYEKTLPDSFTVSKKWNRDDKNPQITDNVEMQLKKQGKTYNARSRASLTRFLNNVKYIYVPAIKDQRLFSEMLEKLQNIVYSKKLSGNEQLTSSLSTLFENVVVATKELSDEFRDATNVDSMIATPTEVDELYRTLRIITKMASSTVSLENRGDGIRVRYIPSILNYMAQNASENYVWGFEEPENSLEFNMAREMAEDFYRTYAKNSLIMLTTHSPAFIDLGYRENGKGFRCYKSLYETKIVDFEHAEQLPSLAEELGYIQILQRQYDEYKSIVEENIKMKDRIEDLETELLISQKPVLLTEGKTDAKILTVAWEKLYGGDCPFDIKSCNLLDDQEEQAIAGAGVLKNTLCTWRSDSTKTIIGLFDNDKAGLKEFGLDGNYCVVAGKPWKIHKNKKGYAFVIPANNEMLKKIEEVKNLSIEFLFGYESLCKEVNGKKLEFEPMIRTTLINGIQVKSDTISNVEWYYNKIKDDSKVDFAYTVVPTFEKKEFENFIDIFSTVLDILEGIN